MSGRRAQGDCNWLKVTMQVGGGADIHTWVVRVQASVVPSVLGYLSRPASSLLPNSPLSGCDRLRDSGQTLTPSPREGPKACECIPSLEQWRGV